MQQHGNPPPYDQKQCFQHMSIQQTIQPPSQSCPPGLEYLARVDQLMIKQKMDKLAMWTHFKGANKYTINNSMGQQVFLAEEKSDGLSRQVFGNRRSFDMEVTDNSGRSILHFNKTLDGLSEMRVKSPITGQLLGVIKEKFAMTKVVFEVFHPNGTLILRIKGGCFGFVKGPFEIVRPNGQQERQCWQVLTDSSSERGNLRNFHFRTDFSSKFLKF